MEKTFSDLIKDSIEEEENKIKLKNEEQENLNKNDFEKIKNKIKKNFFAGFGLGLVFAAIALFIFQPLTKKEIEDIKNKKINEMTNAEIIERAKALGMEFRISE